MLTAARFTIWWPTTTTAFSIPWALAEMPDDEQLLTFTDLSELDYRDLLHGPEPGADVERARELLREHGDVFRHHLLIACLLEQQADDIEHPSADKAYGK